MVSPKPLSDFVPDVTLIAFPIPAGFRPRGGRTFSSRESSFRSRQENGLDSDVKGKFRRKPDFALARFSTLRRFRRLFADVQSTVVDKPSQSIDTSTISSFLPEVPAPTLAGIMLCRERPPKL
jgi:hypothetical protein